VSPSKDAPQSSTSQYFRTPEKETLSASFADMSISPRSKVTPEKSAFVFSEADYPPLGTPQRTPQKTPQKEDHMSSPSTPVIGLQSPTSKEPIKDTEDESANTSTLNLKSEITKRIRDPSLIDDERLREEVKKCVLVDDNYSPLVDKIRHTTGLEYEFILMVRMVDDHFLTF
jgi:hypothetical protein